MKPILERVFTRKSDKGLFYSLIEYHKFVEDIMLNIHISIEIILKKNSRILYFPVIISHKHFTSIENGYTNKIYQNCIYNNYLSIALLLCIFHSIIIIKIYFLINIDQKNSHY